MRTKCYPFIYVLILSLASISSLAQSTQNVRGIVRDSESNFPITGAKILLLNESENRIGALSNEEGRFTLENVPVGRQSFEIRFVGYKTIYLNNILVTAGKEPNLELFLVEELTTLNKVVVAADNDNEPINDMVSVSVNKLKIEEVTKFSGTLGDVSRMAQNYAGVSGASDDRNDIIVRGNSPSNVLWRLEGVDIPSPNHWSTLGTSGGPVSMLNANNLSNSDFLAGAFPAEYGNSVGAVFDLNLRNGNSEKFEFLGQVGFNGFEGGIEGPLKIGKNASFLMNYRYSTLAVVNALGVNFGTGFAVPEYQDLTFKLNVPTENAGRFAIWGIGGISTIQFLAETDEDNFYSSGAENLQSGTTTGMLGFNHLYFFNSKTSSKISLLATRSNNETYREENIDTTDLTNFQPTFVSHNAQNKYTANWTLNHKFNARHRIKAGVNFDVYDFNVVDSILLADQTSWFDELLFTGNTSLARAFIQWKYRINEKITLNTGFNALYFGLNESFSPEPRIGLTYSIFKQGQIGMAYGKHAQLHPMPIYFSKDNDASAAENQKNENLDFIKSDHYVLSYSQGISKNWNFKTELYYQKLYSIAEDPNNKDFSLLNFGAGFGFPNTVGLENSGTGQNYGVEFTLNRSLNNGFYALVTASLFNSTFEGANNIERNTYYNSNYVFNTLFGKEMPINDKFTFTVDARFTYSGGRRYTPIDLEASNAAGYEILEEDRVFEARLAPYIRPDIKLGMRYNSGKFTHNFSVDFQNFIGRENELFKRYYAPEQRIKTERQRGFFPDVRYQLLF